MKQEKFVLIYEIFYIPSLNIQSRPETTQKKWRSGAKLKIFNLLQFLPLESDSSILEKNKFYEEFVERIFILLTGRDLNFSKWIFNQSQKFNENVYRYFWLGAKWVKTGAIRRLTDTLYNVFIMHGENESAWENIRLWIRIQLTENLQIMIAR